MLQRWKPWVALVAAGILDLGVLAWWETRQEPTDFVTAPVANGDVARSIVTTGTLNRRFDANFCKVRETIERGEIGQLHLLRITSRDSAPPLMSYIEVSGGMFLDMTIHDFDMSRYLTGSEVEELSVAAGALVDPAIGEAGETQKGRLMSATPTAASVQVAVERVFDDYGQLLRQVDMDALFLLTSKTPHARQIVEPLEAG